MSADLLIVVGARFSDRVTGNASKFAKNAKILQMDIDPAEINKNIQTDASIIGDVKVILRKLNARLDPMNHEEWIAAYRAHEGYVSAALRQEPCLPARSSWRRSMR